MKNTLYMEEMMMIIKIFKIFFIVLILFIISTGFILRIDHFKNYIFLIPTFIMYIFIPLSVVLNLTVRN